MLQAIFEVVFEFVFYTVTPATGHGLLWVLTLGRWRALDGRDDAAMIVGLTFWALVLVAVVLLVVRS